jgi:IS5 family transposase
VKNAPIIEIFIINNAMRTVKSPQLQLGGTLIENIKIDLNSRDDIPPLLLGLQHIYTNVELRHKVFEILEQNINSDTDNSTGRPGMELWKILVFGVLRLNLNWDYDRLVEMANNHKTIRRIIGHGTFTDDYEYKLQTLKDNVALLTPAILDEINTVVVEAGHSIVKKKEDEELRGRCDSFVVETNVHYPTDINLLFDAMRKVISLTAALCTLYNLSGWRQSTHNIETIKRLFRTAQQLKRSTSKDQAKKDKREELIKAAHQQYIDVANSFLDRARVTLNSTGSGGESAIALVFLIENFIAHAQRQIDQIHRRVILGEKIPHGEKVFSIFEEHTEWISKGKAGVPVELGLKVCVLEDQHGFLLHHRVMEHETDDQIAVTMVEDCKKKFSTLTSCSFDKGFHSPANQTDLQEHLDRVILPRKGKLSLKNQEREYSPDFIKARHQHSAVESAINALEVHGLDRCPDHGIEGFKRYVSLAVLARNIQQLGVKIRQRELALLKEQGTLKKAA